MPLYSVPVKITTRRQYTVRANDPENAQFNAVAAAERSAGLDLVEAEAIGEAKEIK